MIRTVVTVAAVVLAMATVVSAQHRSASYAEAVALARGGRHHAALAVFDQIVREHPDDLDSRLWIARLTSWLGRPEQSATLFRELVIAQPTNAEALMGLGSTLVALGEVDEGVSVLEQAEAAEPGNADVLAALGRAYRRTGNVAQAFDYARRAATITPSPDNRAALEQLRLVHGHRLEVTSSSERFGNGLPGALTTDAAVNVRLTNSLRLSGRGQLQRRVGSAEQRGGPGIEWRLTPATAVSAHLLAGPGNVLIARHDVNLEVDHNQGVFDWTAGYRQLGFAGAQVSMASPGLTWWPSERASLGMRYFVARTRFDASASSDTNHSGMIRASLRTHRRVWLQLGYSRGTESFETLSVDRIGEFRADTAAAGIRIDLPSLTSLVGGYEYQQRSAHTAVSRVTVSLLQRF